MHAGHVVGVRGRWGIQKPQEYARYQQKLGAQGQRPHHSHFRIRKITSPLVRKSPFTSPLQSKSNAAGNPTRTPSSGQLAEGDNSYASGRSAPATPCRQFIVNARPAPGPYRAPFPVPWCGRSGTPVPNRTGCRHPAAAATVQHHECDHALCRQPAARARPKNLAGSRERRPPRRTPAPIRPAVPCRRTPPGPDLAGRPTARLRCRAALPLHVAAPARIPADVTTSHRFRSPPHTHQSTDPLMP